MNSATTTMVVAPLSALASRCGSHEPRGVVHDAIAGRWPRRPGAAGDLPGLIPVRLVLDRHRAVLLAGTGEDRGAPRQVRGDGLRVERHRRPTLTLVLVVAGEQPAG